METLASHQPPSNKEVSLVVTRMMHDGTRWQAPWHISICIPTFINTTHRYSLTSFFFACPSSRLCARLPFSPFVSESEETSLSVSAFSLLCARRHTHTRADTHTRTQIQYVHRHTNTCTHRDTHTHSACLLLLWWLRAVKTSSLSLPLSHKGSLTELVDAGSQRLLSIRPHSLFLSFSLLFVSLSPTFVHLVILLTLSRSLAALSLTF